MLEKVEKMAQVEKIRCIRGLKKESSSQKGTYMAASERTEGGEVWKGTESQGPWGRMAQGPGGQITWDLYPKLDGKVPKGEEHRAQVCTW